VGERGTVAVTDEDQHSLRVDQPVADGGHGEGAGPLTHLLGAAVAASHLTLHKVAQGQGIGIGKVRWRLGAATDETSAQNSSSGAVSGVFGTPDATDARLRQLLLRAEVETDGSQLAVKELCQAVQKAPCVVMDTMRAAGVQVQVHFRKKHDFKSSMGTHLD